MKETGILFRPPMVRALLDGGKTQTRRLVKPQFGQDAEPEEVSATTPEGWQTTGHSGRWWDASQGDADAAIRCPYGQPGDRLWVRESFVAFGRWETRYSEKKQRDEWHFVDLTLESGQAYRFDGAAPHARRSAGAAPTWHNRPSLFMPRKASRILLEIVSVRVERLQDISNEDCLAEGIHAISHGREGTYYHHERTFASPYNWCYPDDAYRALWEQINGAGSWDANPWVWSLEFRRVKP